MTTSEDGSVGSLGALWKTVGRGSTTLAVATLVGGAIVYVATPIVTRVFDPAALGSYGVYLAAVALLMPLATLGYPQAVGVVPSDDDAWSLVESVLAIALRLGVVVLVALAIGFALTASGVWEQDLPVALWVVPFGILFATGQVVLLQWLVRIERYSPAVRARLAQGGSMAVGQPALGVLTGLRTGATGAIPLAIGDALSTAVGLGVMARRSGRRIDRQAVMRMRRDRRLLRRYRHFMLAGVPASELNAFTLQIPFLVIVTVYGATSAGQYALIERLFLTPVGIITSAVTMVLTRQAALRSDDPAAVRSMFRRITLSLAVLGAPLILLAFLDTRAIVAQLLGPAWEPAAQMLRPLSLLFFVNLVATPWGATLAPTERQDVFLVREVVRMLMIGGAALWIVVREPALLTGVTVLAWVSIASYVWYFAVCSWALRHPRAWPEGHELPAMGGGGP
ncbi:MAG TPA: oligosaccharide flippase family protein [Actinomycetota bacterium]|jgi:O-antigen/teichoic acid export membrane protein